MLNEQEKQVLMRGYRMVRNVWIISVILLLILVVFTRVQIDTENVNLSPSRGVIRIVFAGVSLFLAVLSFILRAMLKKRKRHLKSSKPGQTVNTIVFRQALLNYRSAILFTSQLSLGMVVPGIILVLMGHGPAYLYGFAAAAFITLIIHRPRINEFESMFNYLMGILTDLQHD